MKPRCAVENTVVTLWRQFQALEVRPAVEELRTTFRSRCHVLEQAPGGGCRVGAVPAEMIFEDTEPALYFGAGLEPAVRLVLERHGYRINTLGSWPAPLCDYDKAGFAPFAPVDPDLLAYVQKSPRGLIRSTRPRVDPARLIDEIARAWPGKKIAIIVA